MKPFLPQGGKGQFACRLPGGGAPVNFWKALIPLAPGFSRVSWAAAVENCLNSFHLTVAPSLGSSRVLMRGAKS